jgi:hypothetical protein
MWQGEGASAKAVGERRRQHGGDLVVTIVAAVRAVAEGENA